MWIHRRRRREVRLVSRVLHWTSIWLSAGVQSLTRPRTSPRRTIATSQLLYMRFHLFFPYKDFNYMVSDGDADTGTSEQGLKIGTLFVDRKSPCPRSTSHPRSTTRLRNPGT